MTPLEERRLLSADGFTQPEYIDFVQADVVGRHAFYNHSAFDGQDAALGPADDGAIATDKQALLPGQTASFVNYTSFSRGLNGVMVDVAGLPGTPTAADFSFEVSGDPAGATWSAAPAPQAIGVRRKAGVDGSDRITIAWADGAIAGTWLRVTVRAAAATGLARPDVFYFGNAIGETGNSATDAVVDALDRQAVADNPRGAGNPAPVTFAFDINRDRLVDAADVAIVDAHYTTPATALRLLAAPPVPTGPEYHRAPTDLYQWGDADYPVYFGPTMLRTKAGSVLVFAEGRASALDSSSYALVVRRSTDGGVTFSEPTTINSEPFINSGSPVQDEQTGTIFFVYTQQVSRVEMIRSDDDGVTWSAPVDITAGVKVTGPNSPLGHTFPPTPWEWYAIGPGHGIQLQHGPWAGRLLLGADHRYTPESGGFSWSHVIYSDDHGATWHLGGGFSDLRSANDNTNEVTLVEEANGDVYMSMRIVRITIRTRGYSRSSDGGMTWTETKKEPAFTVPSMAGTLLRLNENVVLFLCSDSDTNTRRKLTVWASYDETQTWVKKRTIFYAFAGYQDAAVIGPDTVLVAFNRGHVAGPSNSTQKIGLARFNLRWLESDRPDEFAWYFNERAAGTAADTTGTSIVDYSPWDNRAQARSNDAPPVYAAGPNGDAALALTAGSDHVLLAPAASEALQFAAGASFTAEFVIRTTGSDGVLVGTLPGVRNWTVRLAAGKPTFSLYDLAATPTVVGDGAINDGQWHHLAVVRDAGLKQLRLYVDRVLAAAPVADTTTASLRSDEAVTLGQYNDGSGQLAVTVDALRVTRGVVAVADFLPAAFANPVPLPPPTYSAINPTTIPGLRLWMPAFDPSAYFADAGYSDPLRLVPTQGDGVRSAIDRSGANWHATTPNFVQYEYDAILGPHLLHSPVSTELASTWRVRNSNGTQANNFDFIQNTGVFTISMFVKPGQPLAGYGLLLDSNEGSTANPGIWMSLLANGQVQLAVSAGGTARVQADTGGVKLERNRWYHLAVVANGPGNPVTFYVTPYSGAPAAVQAVASGVAIAGADGNYPTDANHDLTFAGRARINDRGFNGALAQQAIFDRALTLAQIQQLFDFGTEFKAPPPLQPVVTPAGTLEDGVTTGGLVVRRNPGNGLEVSYFKVDQITGGTLYLSNGTTSVHNGDFITYQQGTAGLRFRPTPNSVAPGTFLVWSATTNDDEAVGGDPAVGTVEVTPVNDPPSFHGGDNQVLEANQGPQVVPGWATEISAGPANEAAQSLAFELSTDNDGLFAVRPQLSSNGTLTYTSAPNAVGIATVSVVLHDDGGVAYGGVDRTATETFTIAVGPMLRVDGDEITAGPDEFRVVRNGDNVEVYVNNSTNVPNQSRPLAGLNFLIIRGLAGNDRLVVDFAGGNPLPLAGIGFDGGAGDDTVQVVGGTAGEVRPHRVTPGKADLTLDGRYLQVVAIESLRLTGQSTLAVRTPGSDDALALDSLAGGTNRLTGTSDLATIVPITVAGLGTLVVDTAANDAGGGDDSIVVDPAGLVGAHTLRIAAGTGDNSLTALGGVVRLDVVDDSRLDVTALGTRLIADRSQAIGAVNLHDGSVLQVGAGVSLSAAALVGAGTTTLDVAGGGQVLLGETSSFSIGAGALLKKLGAGRLAIGGWQDHAIGSTLEVEGGTVAFDSQAGPAGTRLNVRTFAAVELRGSQWLESLEIGDGGAVRLAPNFVWETRALLFTHRFVMAPTGRFDLADNSLIVEPARADRAAALAAISGYIQRGLNDFQPDGVGLFSSVALDDPLHVTTVGVFPNNDTYDNPIYLGWRGQSLTANSIIVSYTYFGDADLNSFVDGTDYACADNGFNSHASGWLNGDFDLSGLVDGTDYALLDNAFNAQETVPAATVLPVEPSPRQTPVDELTIVFSRPVVGFDLSDLTLSRDLGANLIGTAQTLATTDHITWTVGNLGALTATSGSYSLTVLSDQSEIRDLWGHPLAGLAVGTFVVDKAPPVADVVDISPDPRATSVQKATIVFDGPVTGVDASDFRLTRDGGPNLLTAAQTAASVDGRTWTLGNLADLTRTPGAYTLTLVAAGSGIADLAGNALVANAADGWVLQAGALLVTNTADAGPGSLRSAIDLANANGLTDDVIAFDILGSGPHAIQLHTPLPALAGPVTMFVDADVDVLVGVGSPYTLSSYGQITKRGGGSLTIGGSPTLTGPAILWVAEGLVRLTGDGGPNLTVIDAAHLEFAASEHLAQLTILENASAKIDAGGDKVLVTSALPIASSGVLDVADNRLIVQAAPAAFDLLYDQLRMAVVRGSHNLGWDGIGIRSSAAAADPQTATGVGIIANRNAPHRSFYASYAGTPVDGNSILVAYALYGDCDLSGSIDGLDYALIDNGFAAGLSGWSNGDFNYDGVVDGTDWLLFGNALNATGGTGGSGFVGSEPGDAPPLQPVAPVPHAAAKDAVALVGGLDVQASDDAVAELFGGARRARQRSPAVDVADCLADLSTG